MLHDAAFDRAAIPPTEERRISTRVEYRAELIMQWHHDPHTKVRYRVIDFSEGGFRLHSSLPMLEGMTGVVLRLLPECRTLSKPVMVAWSRPPEAGPGFELGLRFIEAI